MQIAWYGTVRRPRVLPCGNRNLNVIFLGFIGVDLCSLCNGEGSASGAGAIK